MQRMNSRGLGVGVSSHGPVEVPYALPGELIRFQRHTYRGKPQCVFLDVVEPAAHRQAPSCPVFGRCGGCLLQHLPSEDYGQFKLRLLTQSLAAHGLETEIAPLLTVPPSERRRANMEAVNREGGVLMGFHKFHANQIVDLEACPALLPCLSVLIPPLKAVLHRVLGPKQKAQIFLTAASNGVDLTLELYQQPRLQEQQRAALIAFAQKVGLVKLVFRAKRLLDVVYQTEEPYVCFDGVPVEIDAHGFLQASVLSDRLLHEFVVGALPLSSCEATWVDLFCGRGTYTLPLSRYVKVDGFESDPKALQALGRAARNASRPIRLAKRDLFADPLRTEELTLYQGAVINPPRSGALRQIEALASSSLERIVYISCNPDTFAQDAKRLLRGNFSLRQVTPLDQFFWSPHLEVLALFDKR